MKKGSSFIYVLIFMFIIGYVIYKFFPDVLPIEKKNDHIFLEAKDMGDCRTLEGDVTVSVVFVDDLLSRWTDEDVNAFKELRKTDEEILEREADRYGIELDLNIIYTECSVSTLFNRNDTDPWEKAVLKAISYPEEKEVIKELKAKHSADEATIVFARNDGGRSFAEQGVSPSGFECAILYDGGAFRHELLHIFGAKDFYFPDTVKDFAGENFPESVMLSSKKETVDTFSAYLIGWMDKPDEKSKSFIEFTKDMTNEYINDEHEKETFTGYGTKINDNGTYEGDLVDGIMHGKGTYVWDDGDTYTGGYNHGKMHGTGTMTWANGDTYIGDFLDGERTGKGTYTWATGESYTGDFLNGKRTGKGTYIWVDGDTYTGDFVDNKMHGKGTYTWITGEVYTGDYVEGKRTGYGEMTWPNGDKYTGQFVDGERHGHGTYYYGKSKKTRTGTWANGDFVK